VSKRFDASPKALLEYGPADWPPFVGVRAQAVEIVDADVSTVTAAADKVLVVHTDAGTRIQHFDFQSGPDASLPRRTLAYNAMLEVRHELPVESIVILLSRKANLRVINGKYDRQLPGEKARYLRFRYRVIRLWEVPVDVVLESGTSVLPLAPISDVEKDRLPEVIGRMEHRFAGIGKPARAAELWTATKVLMGLRYDKLFTDQLLRGVRAMKESVTYQAIVEEGVQKGLQKGLQKGHHEGEVREARKLLLRMGTERYNAPPSPQELQELNAILDVGTLEDMVLRAPDVNGWSELLASPEPRPRRRKKS
jgi:predicted transposase YdaD